jgi:hypothetical protein
MKSRRRKESIGQHSTEPRGRCTRGLNHHDSGGYTSSSRAAQRPSHSKRIITTSQRKEKSKDCDRPRSAGEANHQKRNQGTSGGAECHSTQIEAHVLITFWDVHACEPEMTSPETHWWNNDLCSTGLVAPERLVPRHMGRGSCGMWRADLAG